MRADKWLSHVLNTTRKDAQSLIRSGEIKQNGVKLRSPKNHIKDDDIITHGTQELVYCEHYYIALHKPLGYVCATFDLNNPTVMSLIHHPAKDKLHIVGRLDVDTTGLILLTSDGEWTHKIISPKHDCPKTYQVTLAEPLSPADKQLLEQGILLKSEEKPTLPAKITMHSATEVEVILTEGKYHQVKRMFAAVNNRVTGLHRTQVGGIKLSSDIEEGESRMLTEAEVSSIL